jgi:UDP-2,4-diacetamido-2,4,6-trideoxy-beta-L-altropyranose hydrolase
MGTGHVMRCLALAEELHDRGVRVVFASAELTPSVERRLENERVEIYRIEPAGDQAAEATMAAAKQIDAGALVADGYHLGTAWRLALRTLGRPILAFQDMDDGAPLHADLLLNIAADPGDAHWRAAAPAALFLAGPRYVLLRRELRRASSRPMKGIAERPALLVTLGGADPAGLTLPVATALTRVLGARVRLDVVVGGSVPDGKTLADRVAALGVAVTAHLDPLEMGGLMRRAGLAVSAAGGTIGELAAHGVPALVVTVAENQRAGAAAAEAAGWCEAVDGRSPEVAEMLAARAAALWSDPDRRAAMAACTVGQIDGGGAERVVDALIDAMQTIR